MDDTQIVPVLPYAEQAPVTGNYSVPDADVMNRGVEPLDTLPAAWWNWMWNKITTANISNVAAIVDLRNEIKHAIALRAGVDPDKADSYQLRDTIRQLIMDKTNEVDARLSLAITALEDVVRQLTIESRDADAALTDRIDILTTKHDSELKELTDLVNGLHLLWEAAVAAHERKVGTPAVAGHVKLIDSLTCTDTSIALSAAQGKVLADEIAVIQERVNGIIIGDPEAAKKAIHVAFDNFHSCLHFYGQAIDNVLRLVDLSMHPWDRRNLPRYGLCYTVTFHNSVTICIDYPGIILPPADVNNLIIPNTLLPKLQESLTPSGEPEGYHWFMEVLDGLPWLTLHVDSDLLQPTITFQYEGDVQLADGTMVPNIFKQPTIVGIADLVQHPFIQTPGEYVVEWKMNGLPYKLTITVGADTSEVTIARLVVGAIQAWFNARWPTQYTMWYDSNTRWLVLRIEAYVPDITWEFDYTKLVENNIFRAPVEYVLYDLHENPYDLTIVGNRTLTIYANGATHYQSVPITVADDYDTVAYKVIQAIYNVVTPRDDFTFSWDLATKCLSVSIDPELHNAQKATDLRIQFTGVNNNEPNIFKQEWDVNVLDVGYHAIRNSETEAHSCTLYYAIDGVAHTATYDVTASYDAIVQAIVTQLQADVGGRYLTVQRSGNMIQLHCLPLCTYVPNITFDYSVDADNNIFKQPYRSDMLSFIDHPIILDTSGTYGIGITIAGTYYEENTITYVGHTDEASLALQMMLLLMQWLPADQTIHYDSDAHVLYLMVPASQPPVAHTWKFTGTIKGGPNVFR